MKKYFDKFPAENNPNWAYHFKNWQANFLDKCSSNILMIQVCEYFRKKITHFLSLIKTIALNKNIYFLVANLEGTFQFIPFTGYRKLEKKIKNINYLWINESSFLNLIKDNKRCIALLANESIPTIRFLANSYFVSDKNFLSLSGEMDTDIEVYQIEQNGNIKWMGYENGEYDTGLINYENDEMETFNPKENYEYSIYGLSLPIKS